MDLNSFSKKQSDTPKVQFIPEPISRNDNVFGIPHFFWELFQLFGTEDNLQSGDRKSFHETVEKYLQSRKDDASEFAKYLPEIFQFDPPGKTSTDPLKFQPVQNRYDPVKHKSLVAHMLKPFEKIAYGRLDPVKADTWGIKEILNRLHLYFDVDSAPESFLPWLAGWAAFEWVEDPGWEKEVAMCCPETEVFRRWLPVDLFYSVIKKDAFIGEYLHLLFDPMFHDFGAMPDEVFNGVARWTARSVAIEWGEEWNTDYENWDEENINRFRSLCKKILYKIYKRFNEFFSEPEDKRGKALLWLSRAFFAPYEQFIIRMNENDEIDNTIHDLFDRLCNEDEKIDSAASPSIVNSIKQYTAIELSKQWTGFWPRPGDNWDENIKKEFQVLCKKILNQLAEKCNSWFQSPGRRTGCLTWWLRLFTYTIDPLYKGRIEIPEMDLIDAYYNAFERVFTFDPMCQLRRLLSNVLPDYERRGTREGFEELLTVYLGEDWAGLAINELLNPFQIGCDYKGRKLAGNHSGEDSENVFDFSKPEFKRIIGAHLTLRDFVAMGNRGLLRSVVGCSTVINEGIPYFFRVHIETACPHKPVLVRRKKKFFQDVIKLEKPAHTDNSLSVKVPSMCVGRHSTIDKDTLIGGLTL